MRPRPPISSINKINMQLQAQTRTQSEPTCSITTPPKPKGGKKVMLPPPTLAQTLPNTFINKVSCLTANVADEKDELSDDEWNEEFLDELTSRPSTASAPILIPSPKISGIQKFVSPKANSLFGTTIQKNEPVQEENCQDDPLKNEPTQKDYSQDNDLMFKLEM